MTRAAIGFRDHSGWAVMVALGGDPRSPEVVLRERVDLLDDPSLPGQVYHAAVGRGPQAAAALIAAVERSARAAARTVLGAAVADLRERGHKAETVVVGLDKGRLPADLAKILANHTSLHVAEGELYREALADAAQGLGLRTVRQDFRTLDDTVAPVLGPDARDRVNAWRRDLGPPWTREHKDAALAGWLALTS